MESPGRLRFQHGGAARQLFRADGLSLEEAAGHTLTSRLSWLAYLIGSAVTFTTAPCFTMSSFQR